MKLFLWNTNLATRSVISQILSSYDSCIILTDQKSIKDMADLIELPHTIVIYLESVYNIITVFRAKSIVKNLFRNNHIDHIYMYHQGYGDFYNWIIRYAHCQDIPITYKRVLSKVKGEPCYCLRSIFLRLKFWCLYRVNYDVIKRYDSYGFQFLLSKHFFKKNKIVEEQAFINSDSLDIIGEKIFGKLNLKIQPNSIILLTGGLSDVGYVTREVHEKKSAELINRLGNNRIICKKHPRFDDESKAEKELPHIPSFISMELLMHFFNCFIGYSSSVLLNTSKEGICSISLIDYYGCSNEHERKFLKQYLSDAEVFYPQNLEQLENTIYEAK